MSSSLLLLVVVLGLGHIVARARDQARLAGVLKPVPIALLAAVTLGADGGGDTSYRALVGAALIASMTGDILLISKQRFVPGLLSFLVAHLFYIAAFVPTASGGAVAIAMLAPFLVFATLTLRGLWPHLGHHRIPVLVYVAVITTMGWLATLRAVGGEVAPESGLTAMIGAFSFMASDATLAVDRFVGKFAGAHVFIMATYYAAQILLTLSAVA